MRSFDLTKANSLAVAVAKLRSRKVNRAMREKLSKILGNDIAVDPALKRLCIKPC